MPQGRVIIELKSMFASEEIFEVGFNSQLSRNLQEMFQEHSGTLLESLRDNLFSQVDNLDVICEVLRWVSRQEAEEFREICIELLSSGSHHPSSTIRDVASLSLANLDETKAIPILRAAHQAETVPELKEDLADLICSLE